MYVRASITTGDADIESTAICEYKESNRCDVGGCLAEVFAKADCRLSTLADMMDELLTSDVLALSDTEYTRLKNAIEALKEE